jgi:hypothetical protein
VTSPGTSRIITHFTEPATPIAGLDLDSDNS